MTELWESTFANKQMMWGPEPARSAFFALDKFVLAGAHDILVPGLGYGRNAVPFLDHGMSVTGIEISATAIRLARSEMHLDIPIHHGSVTDMPFDARAYDGIFCYGLLYLLDEAARAKFLADCQRQLRKGGTMIFSVVAKTAPMFGRGAKLGEDWYEVHPGVRMYFYDATSIARELGAYGEISISEIDEPQAGGVVFPFLNIVCRTT